MTQSQLLNRFYVALDTTERKMAGSQAETAAMLASIAVAMADTDEGVVFARLAFRVARWSLTSSSRSATGRRHVPMGYDQHDTWEEWRGEK